MRRKMNSVLWAVALASLVVTGACSKDKGGASGASKGKPAGAAASALDILPEDTAILGGVNVQKIMGSKLWAEYSPQFMNDGDAKEAMQKAKDYCGMDLTKDIDSVVMGASADLAEDKMVILVKGKFDEAKLTKCFTTVAEKEEQKKLTAKTEGKITEYSVEGEEKKVYIGWAGSDTVVIVPAAMEGNKAALEAVMNAKTHAKDNKELSALMANSNTGDTLWVAMLMQGKLKDQIGGGMAAMGPQPTAMWINLAYQKELGLEVGSRFANEKDAKDVVEKAGKEIEPAKADPQVGEYLKSLKMSQKGNDAVFALNLSEKQVDELVAKVKDMLPFLLMGLAGGAGGGM